MKTYKYNKDQFEFYMPDDSTVQAWQVEDSNVWTLEIFPPNQSKESFESCQYDGGITIGKEWYIREYPETWTNSDKELFRKYVREEIEDIRELETVGD